MAGKHLHLALSDLHGPSQLVFWISRSTDLRYHHSSAPEEHARLETVVKSIWGVGQESREAAKEKRLRRRSHTGEPEEVLCEKW